MNKNKVIQGEICFTGSLTQLLFNNNCVIPEEVVFGLGFGLDLELKISNNIIEKLYCLDILDDYDKISTFFKDIGIKINMFKFCKKKEFLCFLEAHYQKSVIVAIDSFNLPYWSTYLKEHNVHVVVANIWESILIQDNFISAIKPKNKYEYLEYSDLISYCEIRPEFFDLNFRYLCWDINIFNKDNTISKEYIYRRIKQLDSKKRKKSLNNLLCLFEYYYSIDYFNKEVLFDINKKISSNGGLYQSRKLYSKFLLWCALNVSYDNHIKKEFFNISDSFNGISTKWRLISTLILKGSLKKEKPKWKKIVNLTQQNIVSENNNQKKLLKIIDTERENYDE